MKSIDETVSDEMLRDRFVDGLHLGRVHFNAQHYKTLSILQDTFVNTLTPAVESGQERGESNASFKMAKTSAAVVTAGRLNTLAPVAAPCSIL